MDPPGAMHVACINEARSGLGARKASVPVVPNVSRRWVREIQKVGQAECASGLEHADDSGEGLPTNSIEAAALKPRNHRLRDAGLHSQPALRPAKAQATGPDRASDGLLAQCDNRVIVVRRYPAGHPPRMVERPYGVLTAMVPRSRTAPDQSMRRHLRTGRGASPGAHSCKQWLSRLEKAMPRAPPRGRKRRRRRPPHALRPRRTPRPQRMTSGRR
jgi:hypothetical protein